MHRTLFTPSMVEAFKVCKRAYELAYVKLSQNARGPKASVICKRFILRAIAEINRGKLTTVNQVQKYMGQNWPLDKLNEQLGDKELGTRAFLFAYKLLIAYVSKPYKPDGSQIVAVALNARARVAHVRVYVEDTFDLVLWHPQEQRLELIDFHLQPVKPLNPSWPTPTVLIKHHLAERLKTRWPFERVSITNLRLGPHEYQASTITLEESIYRVHWDELVKTLDEMKEPVKETAHCTNKSNGEICSHCRALSPKMAVVSNTQSEPVSLSA